MNYKEEILNKLIEKYEKRTDGSNRRVMTKCLKKEINIPDTEKDEYESFRESVISLKKDGFVDFDWAKPNYIVGDIWLVLENVESVYNYLGRKNKKQKIDEVLKLIDNSLSSLSNGWIYDFIKSERQSITETSKLTGLWNSESKLIEDILLAFTGIDKLKENTVSIRAFSVNNYRDSKFFERNIKQDIVPLIKKHEPSLIDAEDVGDREALAQVGIIMMPEVFEFCGNIKIKFKNGIVDYSPIIKGSCVSGNCLDEIISADLCDTEQILFIENKTNYSEFCLNNQAPKMLVIYHGGLYSPARGAFFKIISNAVTSQKIMFWADIDLGGFNMFTRLKNNIFPTLEPINMDVKSFEMYKSQGLERNEKYIKKLLELKRKEEYSPFYDVIEAIAESGVTVEQESFLG